MPLAALPAQAGNYVSLSCPDGTPIRKFPIGSGRQIHGQGLELWPMLCTATGRFAVYARVSDAERFARLEALSRRPLSDTTEVRAAIADAPEYADLFAQAEGLTFADIRSTVANTARDTGERIGSAAPADWWRHPTCAGRLAPFDYYLDSGAPCPACAGDRLMVDTADRTEWD